ncbi:manganese-binding transcriptional regulator MntR [Wenxinia marina]|uniref:Transcriptional regulator MntR n=1 Tax=Wenxinia marina DSM 24838 TaxID=1123501 RepID=A0A0D0QED1_9RHOB|nr:manganese-binding transcriptional regulator MntR [Wenxinia marina]KIQ69383.1 iron (metal) dependent repressor, DtxR family [Wenxinia marina DSM 24838]GGL57905.1 transcriptional regulator MntR [Wenxinia marina]
MARARRLHSAERQASNFSRVREAHQTEVAEDYVELISDLIDVHGEARAADLASRLGVAAPTVAKTIRRLSELGLVESQPYRAIFLTEEGRRLAEVVRRRHVLVRDFLLWLGVDAETAEGDAEGIEHHVSEATLRAFARKLGRDG